MVILLLENDAEIDSKDDMGRTALFKAVSWGLRRTVKVLLEHGADINVKDMYGDTALGWSTDLRMLWVVDRALLKRKLIRYLSLRDLREKTSSIGKGAVPKRVSKAREK